MTAASGHPQPPVQAIDGMAMFGAASEAPEPVLEPFEPMGVDDPDTARGGRSRRAPSPPIPDGLITRVRPPVVVPTRVRRLPPGLR